MLGVERVPLVGRLYMFECGPGAWWAGIPPPRSDSALHAYTISAGPNMIFGHLSGHISRGAPSPTAKLPTSLEGVKRALPTDFGRGARSATRDLALEVP